MSMINGSSGAIDDVRAGMHVVDADGEEVGTVEDVTFGDPGAVEPEVDEALGGTLSALSPTYVAGADLPVEHRSRLLRTGYVVVNAKGLFHGRRYAAADEIGEVEGDTVHLTIPTQRLAR